MNYPVRNSSNSNSLPSKSEDLETYNIFQIIASICNAFVSKICEYLPTPSLPTFAEACKHTPCNSKDRIGYLNPIEKDTIELRLLYKNQSRNELDHTKYKENKYIPFPARNCSNNQAKPITYAPWQQMPGKTPAQIDLTQLSQLGMLGKPISTDFHSASAENSAQVVQGKRVNVYDPICDKVLYICGRCECKDKYHLERYFGDNMESQKRKCTDSSVCKCSLCECLSCPFQKEASFAESLESFKATAMRNFIEDEWKGRLRSGVEHEIQACRTTKDCRGFRTPTKIIVSKSDDKKRSLKCNKHDHVRKPCQFSQQNSMLNKVPVKESLDYGYYYDSGFEIDENDKNEATVKRNNILSDEFFTNHFELYGAMNHATNTEKFTDDKCTETVNLSAIKKQCLENKAKHYEYTLKIEIITPNFDDDNTKQATKQKIKRASKNKIKEQTQKVMKDVINDISKNSLLHDVFVPENLSALQPSDKNTLADMKSEELNKKRSILKKISPVSLQSMAKENQNSSEMLTSVSPPRSSKIDDFIVGCATPLPKTGLNKEKGIDLNTSELPSKDEFVPSQNSWNPVTQVDEVEKLVRCVDVPVTGLKVSLSAIDRRILYTLMNVDKLPPVRKKPLPREEPARKLDEKSANCLDDLRVLEPCLRKVSHHTVSLKWKLPKLNKEILGYEILVDGKTIEKILNPKRCLAVVSCLPPVQRVMITIRTLPKNPELRGLYPCTTIGYQPRANKCIRI